MELSLFKIADVLQLHLTVAGTNVTGKRTITIPLCAGFDFPVTITAKALFTKEQVGVLVHIAGDLYAVVAHYPKTGSVTMFLIDSSKVNRNVEALISPRMSLQEAVASLGSSVVKAFHWSSNKWSVLRLPK